MACSCQAPTRNAPLTTKKRKRLPKAAFGLPSSRRYPMPDASHAKNAKARAAQQLAAGHLTRAEYQQIVRKADRVLAKSRRTRNAAPRSSRRAIGAVLGAAIGGAAAGQFYCRRGSGYALGTAASTGVGMAAALVGALVGDALAK